MAYQGAARGSVAAVGALRLKNRVLSLVKALVDLRVQQAAVAGNQHERVQIERRGGGGLGGKVLAHRLACELVDF